MTDADAIATVNAWLMNAVPSEGEAAQLDAQRQCGIDNDAGTTCFVCVPEDADDVVLYADLAKLPRPASARFYEEILALNMPGGVTAGGTLAFDHRAQTLLLFVQVPIASLDANVFADLLNGFMTAVPLVQREVSRLADEAVPDPQAAVSRPAPVHMIAV